MRIQPLAKRLWPAMIFAALMFQGTVSPGHAADANPRLTALSLGDAPKYKADAKSVDWASPNAPKGGVIKQWAPGTFDTLSGDAFGSYAENGKGVLAAGLNFLTDRLFEDSSDEPNVTYGLIAEWVSYPPDISSATFGLRPQARFHDGKPITPEDVIWSFENLKKNTPNYGLYYHDVAKAEKTGEHEVTFTFALKGNRELPQILGQLPVLPKHYWTGVGADGKPRDVSRTTLEPPLGSGPYRIKSVEPGRSIVYERVKDYWASDLPLQRGLWNFDEINITYFRERIAAFEAFKSGAIDFWAEASAKQWATGYEFDALKKGLVKKEEIKVDRLAPMQGFVMNLRRPQFQDIRVRKAFNLAFDFEWANKNLFFDLYKRTGSYFDNSELKATDLPKGLELEILKAVAAQVPAGFMPPEIFSSPYKNPVGGTTEATRANLSEAVKLLGEAGYVQKNGLLQNASGQPLSAEILLDDPSFERLVIPYVESLKKLGIKASVRTVDDAQFKSREDTFDFDIIVGSFAQSHSPGNEQREFWGTAAADQKGSRNKIGIKNPAIDKIIERLVVMSDRDGVIAASKALDRVLLWNYYVVPQWHSEVERVAYWDRFGRPAQLPSQTSGFAQVWWIDADKDKALQAARGR